MIVFPESSIYTRIQAAEEYLFFEAEKEWCRDNNAHVCYTFEETIKAVKIALGCHPNEVIEPHTT